MLICKTTQRITGTEFNFRATHFFCGACLKVLDYADKPDKIESIDTNHDFLPDDDIHAKKLYWAATQLFTDYAGNAQGGV